MNLPNISSKNRLTDSERLVFVDSLATMLHSGIPIVHAIEAISEDATNKNTKTLIEAVLADINSGKTLSEALAAFPDSFDPVLISIIKSGETAGNLDQVLTETAANLKTNIETSGSIKSALFYPALIITVLLGVSFYSFAFSLPKVAEIFLSLRLKLPIYSLIILKFALFFGHYKYYIAAFLLVLILITVKIFSGSRSRKVLLNIVARIPSIANLLKLMDLARFTNTTALLLQAGVPIIQTLEISKNVVVSRQLQTDIEFIREEITQGVNLAEAMKKRPKSFPSLLRRIVGVGEETSSLGKSLASVSQNYLKKFSDTVKNITTIIEPIMLILIAIVVAFVLLSVIAPLYQGIGLINQH